MTRKNRKVVQAPLDNDGRKRWLRFDILEDRRLLAGIDVFLFNDVDSSRSYDPLLDQPMANQAVYVDLNRDGQLNASEPWLVTDSRGTARFVDLSPGEYAVRLLGGNGFLSQSYPTKPSDQSYIASDVGRIVSVESSGNFWSFSSGSLSLRESGTLRQLKVIDFGSDTVVDTVIVPEGQSNAGTGYVLTKAANLTQNLWEISTNGVGSKKLLSLDANDIKSFTLADGKLLVSTGATLQDISILSGDNRVLTRIGINSIAANAQVKSLGGSRIAVLENGPSGSQITVYGYGDLGTRLLGKRTFNTTITAWDVSSSGRIAIDTPNGLSVLFAASSLATIASLEGAKGPVLFDAERGVLLTGSISNANQLLVWNTQSWNIDFTVPVAVGVIANNGATPSFKLDPYGRFLVGNINGKSYQQDLASAVVPLASIGDTTAGQVQFGLRQTRVNHAPVLRPLSPVSVNEDEPLNISALALSNQASDADSDSLVYLVRSQPTNGSLVWNQVTGGTFVPKANFNGQDIIVIQAYDGLAWSEPRSLTISVRPVNDPPTSINANVGLIAENPTYQSLLATLSVQDPDADADYEYQIADARFTVVAGLLKLVAGAINFEKESTLVLPITAIDRKHPADSITQNLTWSVLDQNDPPTGISGSDSFSVPERTKGSVLGDVGVIDEDANGTYQWSLSDGRFQVVDGKLSLSPGTELDFETQSTIGVVLRAMDGSRFVEKTVTVSVTDQNDPPIDLVLTGSGTVGEHRPGVAFGNVSVIDPDQGEIYAVTVDDARFEVIKGVAKVKAGISLTYADPGFIDLIFTATSQRNGDQIKKSGRLHVVKDTTPYHNDANPMDVDGDGQVTPLDPLVIINYINQRGVGPVVEAGEGEGGIPDIDVDGDGQITPLDILILINRLNNGGNGVGGAGEGGNNGGGLGGPLPEGEGEGAPSQLAMSPVAPVFTGSSVREIPTKGQDNLIEAVPSYRHTDASLASYVADLAEEIGPKRQRRR